MLKEFKKIMVMGHGSTSYFPWCSQEILATHSLQSLASTETSPEDEGKNLFVPRKRSKEKKTKEDVLTSVVEVLNDMSQQDTTADLRKFFQEENERARA